MRIVLMFLVVGCRPPAPEPILDVHGARPEAPPTADTDQPVTEPAPEQDGDSTDDDCMARCVEANQMRAVAAEQIEEDCRRDCDTGHGHGHGAGG